MRGRADLVLPPGEDGPGAAVLVRVEGEDLFGYGAREAVVRALAGEPADQVPFGAPASCGGDGGGRRRGFSVSWPSRSGTRLAVPADPRLAPLAFAHGWYLLEATEEGPEKAVIRPVTP